MVSYMAALGHGVAVKFDGVQHDIHRVSKLLG